MILPCLFIMYQPLNAKVEAPNYNFSIETLQDFFPGKTSEEIVKKYGKAEVMAQANGIETLKFQVAHLRFKFPVLIQVKDGVVLDNFARLPSYFLHDIFLQSLVNKFGKQSSYKKTGEEAYYVWNLPEFKHVYSGACTITCFPIFYAVFPKNYQVKPLLEKMNSK